MPRWRRALRDRGLWQRALLLAGGALVVSGMMGRQDWLASGIGVLLATLVAQGWQFAHSTRRDDQARLN
jgi:hypothetical protein